MKKVFLIMAVVGSLTSCQKENQEFCWECRTSIYQWTQVGDYTHQMGWKATGQVTNTSACGLTEDEAHQIELETSVTIQDIRSETKCNKQ